MPSRTAREIEMAVINDYRLKDTVGKPVFSLEEIAYNHKVSVSTICRIFDRHSVPPRSNLERDLAVINDYRLKDSEGNPVFSLDEITSKYEISDCALRKIFNRNSVPPRIFMKKRRSDLFSYSYVISNPKLLDKMIDEYRSTKPDGHYVYSYDKFLKRNNITTNTWTKIRQEKGIEGRRKVSSGANKKRKPPSNKNSVEDLEPWIHEVVEAYNLVDENGGRVYKLQEIFLKFECSCQTFYNLLRMARDKHNLRVKFRRGLKN